MGTEREYTAVVYSTTTGRVLYDLDLDAEPEWSTRVNDVGGGRIIVPLPGDEKTARVREWCVPWRYSIGVLRGDTVCQGGPIVPYSPDDDKTKLVVAFKGFWELLNRRLLHNENWNPATAKITDPSADLSITDSLPNIGRTIADHALGWHHRPGSDLPLDLPPVLPGGGTHVRNYRGYEAAYVGQRLQELTQVDGGPDMLFQPYLTTSGGFRYIRHRMLIGNPLLTQPGAPLRFDYNSTLVSLSIAGDGSALANTAFVKGTGNEAGTLFGYATDTTLIDAGWPALDMVDTNHTSADQQSTLDGWAKADIQLYGSQPEQWQAVVRADADPPLGSYTPGHFADYSVKGHHWLPSGIYSYRILGVSHSGSTPRGCVDHQLQAVRAA
ncbi:hypothetical protein ACFWMR_01845 [Amycolatopsis thailandensis]|uniref:hypothetical protein n=1 Tax=Amycolatopsis thailandensis TaxID=589330 RepID=UPI0036491FD3